MIYSTRLSLRKPAGTDPFLLTDFNSNWDELDLSPGVWVCTSSSRPAGWGVDEAGRMILETDTKKMFIWPGSGSFVEVVNTKAETANTTALAAQTTATQALNMANSLQGGTAIDGIARQAAEDAQDTADGAQNDLIVHVNGGGGTDASTGSQHHTLGVGSLQAARGNHTHSGYGFDINTGSSTGDSGNRTIGTSSSSPTVIDTLTFTLSAQTSVLILGECSYDMTGTLYNNYIYTGFRVDGAAIANPTVVGGGNLDSGEHMFTQASIHRLQTLNAGSHTINLCAYKDSTALGAQATLYRLTVVPIKAFA